MLSQRRNILPGFGISLGFTILYLSLIVLIPLSALFLKSAGLGWTAFFLKITEPRVMASYRLSFGASFIAAGINAVFGFILAWVLVRYRFPGRRIIDAIVDLPFALPTAVSGIALTSLYASHGWIGRFLEPPALARMLTQIGLLTPGSSASFFFELLGIKVAFTRIGVVIALTFIGLPFVVRTIQPALADLEVDVEEAAALLGASRFQAFLRIILPAILPALLTGFALAFARALGEYGSVIFIAGNMPMKTEITPLLIIIKLEQYDYAGATAIALVLLILSFILLFLINLLQWWGQRRRVA